MKNVSRILILIASLALSGCATSRGGKVIDLTNPKPEQAPSAQTSSQEPAQSGNIADFTR